jgi:hypothetical protein
MADTLWMMQSVLALAEGDSDSDEGDSGMLKPATPAQAPQGTAMAG